MAGRTRVRRACSVKQLRPRTARRRPERTKGRRVSRAATRACAAGSDFTTGRKPARRGVVLATVSSEVWSWFLRSVEGGGRSAWDCSPLTGTGVHRPHPSALPSTDAVSWAQGHTSHPDTPPNIYEAGLGAQQQQCPSAQGSKPKNFRLRHLRGLALYLPGHLQPAGQRESHWLGRLLAGGCLPQPEGLVWPLDLAQGTVGQGNSHHSALLEAQLPRDSRGNTASSSSIDPAKGAHSQSGSPEGLGLRPKRSWGAPEESTCPLCKRTRSGGLERP
ncbi:uncharacterized protein C16orf90 homolog [Oryx dammah]|uniref:uncharacterized protein C16orf90 homolog n=1 Tax=Oryx dammah TaxID=59534 RepID=UPI001A9A79D3|nr:uncharacterized protein C16orf90 homolog [Oryx dammah]